MQCMFCSDLFKDFTAKLLKCIKETEHVKEDTVQDILPGVLNTFDQHRTAINAVHSTIFDHNKNTTIDCLENKVEKTVDKVVHVIMNHFT